MTAAGVPTKIFRLSINRSAEQRRDETHLRNDIILFTYKRFSLDLSLKSKTAAKKKAKQPRRFQSPLPKSRFQTREPLTEEHKESNFSLNFLSKSIQVLN